MKIIYRPRNILTDAFDRVRQELAARTPPEQIETLLKELYYIEPLQKCEHDPYTDNCLSCAPRWGFTGDKIGAK